MYGMNLNTAEKRQQARQYFLSGYTITEYPELDAIVGIKDDGIITAMGFSGTKGKPDFNYRFRTVESREAYIQKWLEGRKKSLERKQERKDMRKAPALSEIAFKPGDILYNSWGYDQTNIDFYEVTRVTSASTIFIRRIAQDTTETGFMCGNTTPRPGEFIREEIKKRVQWYENKPYISFEHGCGSKWDGRPMSCSWYA